MERIGNDCVDTIASFLCGTGQGAAHVLRLLSKKIVVSEYVIVRCRSLSLQHRTHLPKEYWYMPDLFWSSAVQAYRRISTYNDSKRIRESFERHIEKAVPILESLWKRALWNKWTDRDSHAEYHAYTTYPYPNYPTIRILVHPQPLNCGQCGYMIMNYVIPLSGSKQFADFAYSNYNHEKGFSPPKINKQHNRKHRKFERYKGDNRTRPTHYKAARVSSASRKVQPTKKSHR